MFLIFQNKIKKLKKILTNELNNTNEKSDMRKRKIIHIQIQMVV